MYIIALRIAAGVATLLSKLPRQGSRWTIIRVNIKRMIKEGRHG